MGIEAERQLAFHCSLGADKLVVRHVRGREQLGRCFEYAVTLYSLDPDLAIKDLLGQEASVEIRLGRSVSRYISGIICEMSMQGTAGRYVVYQVTLRPWLWLLTRNSNCRIFQRESALDIVRSLCKEWDPSWLDVQVKDPNGAREYCVQYRESDFHFISRLLEEEGIYYYFEHDIGQHKLVLVNSSSSHAAIPGFEQIKFGKVAPGNTDPVGNMFGWHATASVVPTKVTLNDFDFEQSLAKLEVSKLGELPNAKEQYERYDYPGMYLKPKDGEKLANIRVQELTANYDVAHGQTDSRGLSTGYLFQLSEHARKDQNHEYLIVAAEHDIDSGSYESGDASGIQFRSRIKVIDSQVQFRSPRTTAVPVIAGAQTAKVVGPEGEEIWTDKYGRVKVQFHWDRDGKNDENSSCYIRVAQVWAGAGWGAMHTPRIGQEVVVEFLEGNVDRPLIVGRVYNDFNEPPYKYPKETMSSGLRSHSTPNAPTDHYNELRFDDEKDKEQVMLRAQRNLRTQVKNSSTTWIGNSHTHYVKKGMKVTVADGDYETLVSTSAMRSHVPKNLYEVSAKAIDQQATDDITFTVKDTSIRIDATSITLSVGSATKITMDLATLTIVSPTVSINPLGALPTPPAMKPPPKPIEPTPGQDQPVDGRGSSWTGGASGAGGAGGSGGAGGAEGAGGSTS